MGPFTSPPFHDLHISRFGVSPKSNQLGIIMVSHLGSLFAEGHNVNDSTPKPPFSVQHATSDSFMGSIMAQGRGTLMAKFDLASTYHDVAVHSQDRSLLGMV